MQQHGLLDWMLAHDLFAAMACFGAYAAYTAVLPSIGSSAEVSRQSFLLSDWRKQPKPRLVTHRGLIGVCRYLSFVAFLGETGAYSLWNAMKGGSVAFRSKSATRSN